VIGDELRSSGHDVIAATVVCPGEPDRRVVAFAKAEGRVVISEDKDFGELAFRDGLFPFGLARLVLPGMSPREKAARLLEVLESEPSCVIGAIAVIEPGRVRIRPFIQPPSPPSHSKP
jgi:predicted nuclease of predicted toxin-antitoxin system